MKNILKRVGRGLNANNGFLFPLQHEFSLYANPLRKP